MKKTNLFEKDIAKIAYSGINRNVQALYKAAESVKATVIATYDGTDFISEFQSRMMTIKRELLESQYNCKTDITGNPIIDNMLFDVKQFDFSRLNEIKSTGGVEYIVIDTKLCVLKYMIATQLDSEDAKCKAETFINNEYYKLNIAEFKEGLEDLLTFSDFAFNEFLDNFFCLHLKEEAIKYYLEAVYVAANQLEDMEYIYNASELSETLDRIEAHEDVLIECMEAIRCTVIDFFLTEAIKYAEFMIN